MTKPIHTSINQQKVESEKRRNLKVKNSFFINDDPSFISIIALFFLYCIFLKYTTEDTCRIAVIIENTYVQRAIYG